MIELIGPITPPSVISQYAKDCKLDDAACGLIPFITNLLRLLVVIAGLYALINIILSGYGFMSAGEDPKKMAAAWGKIWQSLIGLLIVGGAFLLTAIIGLIVFGDPMFILRPQVYGPQP